MAGRYAIALTIAVLGALLALLSPRIPALVLMISNSDVETLPEYSAFGLHSVILRDQLRNCEHVEFDEILGIAYVSCDPGRDRWNTVMGTHKDARWKTGTIHYLEYAAWSNDTPPAAHAVKIEGWDQEARKQFHPLGMARHGRSLFATNHDPSGPFIEQLELSADGRSASHVQTIKHALLHAPNSITALSPTELLITNDHMFPPRHSRLLNQLETLLCIPTGNVVHFNVATGEATVVASLPYANGIALLNSTHVAVASTATPAVYIYSMDRHFSGTGGAALKLTYQKLLRTPFFVDNLSVDAAGHLIAAGHPHAGPIDAVVRHHSVHDYDSADGKEEGWPRAGSYVVQWDGADATTEKTLYIGSKEFGCSSGAGRDSGRGVGFVMGLYERGVLYWKD